MTDSWSPFQDVGVGRGVGLDPGAETEEAPPLGLEADPDRGSEEDQDALVVEAVREGTAGVARDHHQETGRGDDGQGADRRKEAEQRGTGLAVEAAVGQEGGGDSAQDRPVMTAVGRAGEESKE